METLDAIKNRVSTRKFLPKQIEEKDLQIILEAGKQAPVAYNKYSDLVITVVQDKEILKEIDRLCDEYYGADTMIFFNAPTLIFVSSKKAKYDQEYENVACIMENMALAATDINVGNVYLKGMTLHIEEKTLANLLKLEEGIKPIAALGVGYPDGEIKPKIHDIKIERI
ncbi:MAG: nitroreductase family protein [Bacilli bacterium]|nr:nitroreductase family protein [Bacilli bacterium]